jgi:hypothetical protein
VGRHRLQQVDHRVEGLPAQLVGLEVDRGRDAQQAAVDGSRLTGRSAAGGKALEAATDRLE